MGASNLGNETPLPTLILFVSGDAPRSNRARNNLEAALEAQDSDSIVPLEIDVLKKPEKTFTYSVFATPALLKIDDNEKISLLYGDLSNEKGLRDFLYGL